MLRSMYVEAANVKIDDRIKLFGKKHRVILKAQTRDQQVILDLMPVKSKKPFAKTRATLTVPRTTPVKIYTK